MIRNLKVTLQNQCGSVYIDFLIGCFGVMMCIALAMAVLPIFSAHSQLENSATKLMRMAELGGHTNHSAAVTELQTDTGITFSTSWSSTDYMTGSTKVQLGDDIKLTLIAQEHITFGALEFSRPITITVTVHGTSEVYHK